MSNEFISVSWRVKSAPFSEIACLSSLILYSDVKISIGWTYLHSALIYITSFSDTQNKRIDRGILSMPRSMFSEIGGN